MNKTTPVSNAHIEALKHSDSCYNALRLAEEALSKVMSHPCSDHSKALAAIREALANHIPDATKMVAEPVHQKHSEHYWLHEINNARADGYERGYVAGKAEPVKQEPVSSIYVSLDGDREFDDWGVDLPAGRNILYAAPVDAKAIRAEALEEAAKVCENMTSTYLSFEAAEKCAAVIRGLK